MELLKHYVLRHVLRRPRYSQENDQLLREGRERHIHLEGKIGATRLELDGWMKTLPQPWAVAMEATIFTGWVCDHLLPHAKEVKVCRSRKLDLNALRGKTRPG